MRPWLIPMIYVGGSVVCGLGLPRLEYAYLASYAFNLSVASAQAYLAAAASGMMALMGIVFALAFVTVQFSAIAYSPRLVLWFARDHSLFHSLGTFAATFIFALFTLAWVDREASGWVPQFCGVLVVIMLSFSMLLFSRLIQRLTDLQITNVLQLIGDRGRKVIAGMFLHLDDNRNPQGGDDKKASGGMQLGPITQTLKYSGEPRTIAKLDIESLVRLAQRANGTIVMQFAVGDTLVVDTVLLQVHGAEDRLSETELMRAIHLERERTFEQDPKYPIRLLVDVAIKALSPAINDPTTAVQTIDEIEDLLRRLGRRKLDAGYAIDGKGALRLVFPMPTWEDYLALAFDEIRQYGATSVQVMRRLRAALAGLTESLPSPERAGALQRYLKHLDLVIERSPFDAEDRAMARRGDRQGLGLSRAPTK
ncbi:MAG TPA: DUF2254 domain-containing protein [Xanthobacteraceae bacterium]|nr:DUF2254 domain-containing protein [Xanthobacteraceae bacterium]